VSADLTAGHLAAADQERTHALTQYRRVVAAAARLLAAGHDQTRACVVMCQLMCRDLGLDPDPADPAAAAIAMLAAAAVADAARTTTRDDLDGGTP
jgi:hypothetical protein